jgi:malate dehydrogenase
MVTNPLDVMVYLAYRKLGFSPNRVLGMAGCLDSARLRAFVAMELNVNMKNVDAMVLGSHGDAMVPLPQYTTVSGIPITQLMPQERIDALIARTRDGGGEIVRLLKSGSAFYAPASGAARMAQAILGDERQLLPCAAYLQGEYGMEDIFMGVPCLLGRKGVEKVVELSLSEAEREALLHSAEEVREGIAGLKSLGILP